MSPRIWQHTAFRQVVLLLVRCFFAYQLPAMALESFDKYIGSVRGGPSSSAAILTYLSAGIMLGVLLFTVGAIAQFLLRRKPVAIALLVEVALIAAFCWVATMIASPLLTR